MTKLNNRIFNFLIKYTTVFLLVFVSPNANALEVSMDVAAFYNGKKPYAEVYLRVLGSSLSFQERKSGGRKQVGVDVTIYFKKGENIVAFDKYRLKSSFDDDILDLIDVKRFGLQADTYAVHVLATDIYTIENTIEFEQNISVPAFSDEIAISDILLFGNAKKSPLDNPNAKNGLIMEPLTYGIVTDDIKLLYIYLETYRKDSTEALTFLKYSIIEGYQFANGKEIMKKVQKVKGDHIEPHLLKLPVSKLLSGKYHVKVELINKAQNVLFSGSLNFVKENGNYDLQYYSTYDVDDAYSFLADVDQDSINYAVRATAPIVFEPKKSIINYIIDEASPNAQKKFLYDVWKEKYPINTETEFRKYMKVATIIDREFNSNVGWGFETDKGYIFLRYGKPSNVIEVDTEVDAYPYEIWYYNFVPQTNQTNVRFLFYNKSLVHNDFTLLHSTCRGERQTPNWEVQLYQKGLEVPNSSPIDATEVQDSWNRNARRLFNDF